MFLRNKKLFLLTFLITYILIALGMWCFTPFSPMGSESMRYDLEKYVQKHKQELQKDVFGTVFSQAMKCTKIIDPEEKKLCEEQTGKKLGDVLREEELAGKEGYNWPNDLFFVKHQADTFTRLGWNGELKDISGKVNKKLLSSNSTNSLFQSTCNYFNSPAAETNSACEKIVAIPLTNDGQGYMVRLHPHTEEDMLFFYFLSPLILLSQFHAWKYLNANQYPYLVMLALHLILPFIVSFLAVFIFNRIQKIKKLA